MRNNFLFTVLGFIIMIAIGSCKKEELTIPQQRAFFTESNDNYRVTAPSVTYKIPVSLTSGSQSTTVNVSVSSPTGAVQGTHYTLSSTSVAFSGDKVVDTITVTASYDLYVAGRKDTLVFTFSDAAITSPGLNNTFTLAVSGPCFEGDVDLNSLLGDYKNTNEVWNGAAYGPYTTSITGVNSTGATTGTITVANIFDAGWNPVTYTLDWTDPNNRKVTLVQQEGIGDGGTISTTYSGDDISVRPDRTGVVGTFSICNQTITLRMENGITGLGFFNIRYTVNMAR